MTNSEPVSWRTSLKIALNFVLAALALSALTFALVGLNRYFDSVWNDVPKAPYIFTIQGQVFWGALTLIAVITGALILGALALVFPWAVIKGTDLLDLWKVLKERKGVRPGSKSSK